jgi:hypothetical protein
MVRGFTIYVEVCFEEIETGELRGWSYGVMRQKVSPAEEQP